MILADILMWFLIIVGLLAAFNSYWLAAYALFPDWVERSTEAYARPIRAILLGSVIAVPLILLGAAMASAANPVAKLLGLSFLGVPILMGLIGSAGLSRRIGRGMSSAVDESQPWRTVLRGGIVLSLLFLLPFLGWFGVLPLTLLSGAGAVAVAFRRREVPPRIPATEL